MRIVASLLSPFTRPSLPSGPWWRLPHPHGIPHCLLVLSLETAPSLNSSDAAPILASHLASHSIFSSLSWVSQVAPVVKNLSASAGDRDDRLEKGMATHSSIPAWRIPWTEEPGRLQSTELQRVGHDWSNSARALLGLEDPSPLNSVLCTIHYPHALRHLSSSVALCSAVCDNSPPPLLWRSSSYFQLPALYSHLSPQPFISKVEPNTFPTKNRLLSPDF